MQFFSDKGTVDDLGIGTVRDAISNYLFPGTSVIQTRARYFLFIPWIYRRVEHTHPMQLIAKATNYERSLIGALRNGGDHEGLIGLQAGVNVRTLPSAIFWSGLARYRIFLDPGLSIRQYGRHVARGRQAPDFDGELAERQASFWHHEIPDPPSDFFKFERADFDFTSEEATWLSERVAVSDRTGDEQSLLTRFIHAVRNGRPAPPGDELWKCQLPGDTPNTTRSIVRHAERFSSAFYAAALLYNVMLAEERHGLGLEPCETQTAEVYRERLESWSTDARQLDLVSWAVRIHEFLDSLTSLGTVIPAPTKAFIEDWAEVIRSHDGDIADSAAARNVLRRREVQHKRAQARFTNRKRLAEWMGEAGTAPVGYRWGQIRRFLRDLEKGLRSTGMGTD